MVSKRRTKCLASLSPRVVTGEACSFLQKKKKTACPCLLSQTQKYSRQPLRWTPGRRRHNFSPSSSQRKSFRAFSRSCILVDLITRLDVSSVSKAHFTWAERAAMVSEMLDPLTRGCFACGSSTLVTLSYPTFNVKKPRQSCQLIWRLLSFLEQVLCQTMGEVFSTFIAGRLIWIQNHHLANITL